MEDDLASTEPPMKRLRSYKYKDSIILQTIGNGRGQIEVEPGMFPHPSDKLRPDLSVLARCTRMARMVGEIPSLTYLASMAVWMAHKKSAVTNAYFLDACKFPDKLLTWLAWACCGEGALLVSTDPCMSISTDVSTFWPIRRWGCVETVHWQVRSIKDGLLGTPLIANMEFEQLYAMGSNGHLQLFENLPLNADDTAIIQFRARYLKTECILRPRVIQLYVSGYSGISEDFAMDTPSEGNLLAPKSRTLPNDGTAPELADTILGIVFANRPGITSIEILSERCMEEWFSSNGGFVDVTASDITVTMLLCAAYWLWSFGYIRFAIITRPHDFAFGISYAEKPEVRQSVAAKQVGAAIFSEIIQPNIGQLFANVEATICGNSKCRCTATGTPLPHVEHASIYKKMPHVPRAFVTAAMRILTRHNFLESPYSIELIGFDEARDTDESRPNSDFERENIFEWLQ